MLTTLPLHDRPSISRAYRMDETEAVNNLLENIHFTDAQSQQIAQTAENLVIATRNYKHSKIDSLLHQYDLSTDEGIALMCLAEALLRIPDKETIDKFISDKISTVDWKNHLGTHHSLFINAATWSLLLTGKIYSPTLNYHRQLKDSLIHAISRVGIAMVRPIILQMMRAIGNQFVLGEDIQSALTRSKELASMGYQFSYDMLGESARTREDAEKYYQSYEKAIHAIGQHAHSQDPTKNPGISIKLSALHPRYEYAKRDMVLRELTPRLLALAKTAKKYLLAVTVDAEEADRLDLSLDIFERVYADAELEHWEGFGLAVQAYQKRAYFLLDWLLALAKKQHKRMMVRLVKGAYWDAEIKQSQVQGLHYPVFTRKNATDVSYLACAQKLLNHLQYFYPQFGTHNAYSVAAIMQMTHENNQFEFQCLHGMGRPLYDHIVTQYQTRIYAPVGTHKDLLGYLVRRLLENGANSSFINRLADDTIPIEKIIADPVARMTLLPEKPHPKIPLPEYIYKYWQNSAGIDLTDAHDLLALKKKMDDYAEQQWHAHPLIHGKSVDKGHPRAVMSPSDNQRIIGYVNHADDSDVDHALQYAVTGAASWGKVPVEERAAILEQAANLFQQAMPKLITLMTREGGKCIADCISEVRETIDYCRYYAYRARQDLHPQYLPGPTGEENYLCLYPRGVMACISPWNFPLAIFTGQITAALAAGNAVIAKPAEQTPLIAYQAVQILHAAGIPQDALQLLPGYGDIGAKLVSDARVAGVMFTGSTETAKIIEQNLANRKGPMAILVAETGGQNAMIVDSSALFEQTVIDVVQSAFNSAGQRCSALRVLFLPEEIADKFLTMLTGYMAELTIGDPCLLQTDIGPVIDNDALQMLSNHFAKMKQEAHLIAQVAMKDNLPGHFFAPCIFEIKDLNILPGEVFGPILHVIRYSVKNLPDVMQAIINTGYGLTLGIQTRIATEAKYIADAMPVGNMYINRNMIGAVVGVQPFGGERLSGTGPKAGGPHYLPRLCVERTVSNNITAVGGNARLISMLEEE